MFERHCYAASLSVSRLISLTVNRSEHRLQSIIMQNYEPNLIWEGAYVCTYVRMCLQKSVSIAERKWNMNCLITASSSLHYCPSLIWLTLVRFSFLAILLLLLSLPSFPPANETERLEWWEGQRERDKPRINVNHRARADREMHNNFQWGDKHI